MPHMAHLNPVPDWVAVNNSISVSLMAVDALTWVLKGTNLLALVEE